jgi:hypothetical protein
MSNIPTKTAGSVLAVAMALGLSSASAAPDKSQAGAHSNARDNASQNAIDKLRNKGFPGATGGIFGRTHPEHPCDCEEEKEEPELP